MTLEEKIGHMVEWYVHTYTCVHDTVQSETFMGATFAKLVKL